MKSVLVSLLAAAFLAHLASAAASLFDEGVHVLGQEQYDRAIALFSQEIRIHPRNGAAYNNRRLAYLNKGEVDPAIADFNVSLRIRPNYYEGYSNRARAYDKK